MRTYRLDDVCEIVMGQAPAGESYNDRGDGVPLVAGAGDIKDGEIVPSKFTTAPTKLSSSNDVIIGIRASIGMRASPAFEVCLGRGVAALRPKHGLDRDYLWHWIGANADHLAAKGRGATFLQVNRNDIGELTICLPPLDEQRQIARVLDAADAVRAKRRRAVNAVRSLVQALFARSFTRGTNSSTRPLGELVASDRPVTYGILKPGPDTPGGVPYVRVVDIEDGRIRTEAVRRTSPLIAADYRRSVLNAGDLVMSIRGHVGRLAVIPPELSGANITQDSARLAVSDYEARYVMEAIRSPSVQSWMRRRTKGVAVQGINLADVKLIPIPEAAAASQREFATRAAACDRLLAGSLAQLHQMDALAASLQQRAFAGAR